MIGTGDAGEEVRVALRSCALGKLLVAETDKGVCAILLGDAAEPLRAELRRRFKQARLVEGDGRFLEPVLACVEGRAGVPFPLDMRGTPFQRRVWAALREIPPGRTATYAEIARKIGAEKATRAAAAACAANPLAIVVPCHRVIRSDGGLSGYRWGVDRKRALLAREGAPAGAPAVDCAAPQAVA